MQAVPVPSQPRSLESGYSMELHFGLDWSGFDQLLDLGREDTSEEEETTLQPGPLSLLSMARENNWLHTPKCKEFKL